MASSSNSSKRKRNPPGTSDSSPSVPQSKTESESESKRFKIISEQGAKILPTSEKCPSELSASSNFRKYTQDLTTGNDPNISQNHPERSQNPESSERSINEDTCSSGSRLSFVSNENSSDEEDSIKTPRRRLPRKGSKQERGKKRIKDPPKNKLVTTQKQKTDELNQIQITMTTTEVVPEAKTAQKRTEVLKNYIDAGKMTYRVMKRANFVIKTVRQEKVIVDLTKLMKLIREDEQGEGYKASIDKKSLMRLILKLSRNGYIKFRKATLKSDSKQKCVCFICDPNIEDDHSVIISALEQSKMKFFISTKGAKSKEETMLIEEKDLPKDSKNIVKFIDLPQKLEEEEEKDVIKKYQYDRNANKMYGLCPKFVRTRIIHEFLFYLIYENNCPSPITDREEIEKVFHEFGCPEDVFENDRICPIYHRELTWRLFLPPLPKHQAWPHGWGLISDILLRLPLSLFLKCFNVPYIIPDINFYMDHPIRKYYLVKNLPPKIRNGLMHGRRYIFAMHEIVTRLCHMGLLQFGPQKLKEKDQVFVYLNRNTCLFNTVTSPPGYHQIADMEYEKRQYTFKTIQDVETYWYELWSICINTNLGTRNSLTGQFIVVEQAITKPALMEASKPHLPNEVEKYENGPLPGDGRGAAGLDSALFAHLKRNWNWSDLLTYPEKQKRSLDDDEPEKVESVSDQPKKKVTETNTSKKLEPKNKKFKVKVRENKRKRIVRQILPKKKPKNKKPMYDEKDKLCLKKMSKLRTDWTQIEDNVLLLCKVASVYLCPNHRRQNVEYTIMRDVLHKMVPYSNDKTSRSCQRRILYIMKNVKTRRSVHMCIEEIRQDEFVTLKFGAITKKYHLMVIPTETLNIAFVELVIYMNRKFSNVVPTSSKPLSELPDTIEAIKKMYDITSNHKKSITPFKDIETIDDVNFDVVRSVIHSSLCCARDKTSWAFQLFKIYQQYPEALLRSVISKLRHDQMVSIKKTYVKRNGTVPFSSPFQLSISYAYQIQNTRFNFEFYTEANAFLRSLLTWVKDSSLNQDMEITMSDNGTSMLILDILDKLKFEFKFDHPEQVIVLDPVITNDAAYERILNRYNEILKDPSRINYWEEKDKDDEENYPDLDNEIKGIDLNSSMIGRSSTRIAFHMMRAEMCEGVDKNSAQHIHDYFVVNASRVFLKLPENKAINFKNYDLEHIQTQLKVDKVLKKLKNDAMIPDTSGKITSEIVKNFFSNIKITNYDFEYIEKIKCFVHQKGELGALITELKIIEPDSTQILISLADVLSLLTDLKILLRVGTTIPRFVHFDYKTSWIVKADKIVRLEKEKMDPKEVKNNKWKGKKLIKHLPLTDESQSKIKLLVAPWIRLDGSLNRRVFDRWMGTVISVIMEEPGISLQDLTGKFDYLKPVELLYLVEILHSLDCISLIKLNKPKVTLFSKEPDFDFEDATVFDDAKFVMIEPVQDIMYKFAVFMGNKAYSTNFID